MRLFFCILFLSFLYTNSPAQDCSTLAISAAVTSNYNGRQISCYGASDAEITAVAGGGQGPYTYTLNDNGPTNSTGIFNGLPAGVYNIKVTDANNCEATSIALAIVSPPALTVYGFVTSDYNGQQISCTGNADGMITLMANGGTGAFSYTLIEVPGNTSGYVSGIFTGLNASTYTFATYDANGCSTVSNPVILTQPPALSAAITSNNGVSGNCTNGEVSVTPTGGTGAYTYILLQDPANVSGATSGIFTGLSVGTYNVRVSDNNSCAYVTSSATIIQSSDIAAHATITSNYNGSAISCFGNADGEVTVLATGGTGVFTYNTNEMPENTTGATSGVFSNLPAGSYSFTVADESGCEIATPTIALTTPTSITSEGSITSNYHGAHISCPNATDGEITLTANGGTAPYYYLLENSGNESGATTGIFTALSAGVTYEAKITDANGCISDGESIMLNSPDEFFGVGEPVPDQNGGNGGVLLNVSGGTTPYTFLWSNGSTAQNLSNVVGGDYSVVVSDANACTFSLDFEIPVIVSVRADSENRIDLVFDQHERVFYLSCTTSGLTHISIDLIDASGRSVFKTTSFQNNENSRYKLSEETLLPGMYVARIKANQTTHIKKFLVF